MPDQQDYKVFLTNLLTGRRATASDAPHGLVVEWDVPTVRDEGEGEMVLSLPYRIRPATQQEAKRQGGAI